MKAHLLRIKKNSSSAEASHPGRICKLLAAVAFLAIGTHGAVAQTSVTVPDLTASSGFTGVYASSARTYQLIIDDTLLTSLTGKYLTSIAFRLPSNATSSWPATDATFASYEVYLSNGVEPPNRQLDFAANVVGKNDSRVYQLLSALIINHAKVEIPILLMIQRTVYHA